MDGHGGACGLYDLDIWEDAEEPAFEEVPGGLDLSVECDQPTDPAHTGQPTPQDDCPPLLTYHDEVAAGACPHERTITRTWTATDACGHDVEYVQTMQVVDTTAPTATTGSIEPHYATAAEAEAAAIAATTELADNCSDPENLSVAASTAGTCEATVSVTVTDECGNFSRFDYHTRIDGEPPEIAACAAPRTLHLLQEQQHALMPDLTAEVTATDNCPGELTITQDPPAGTEIGLGVHTVVLTATDAAGLSATCETAVTVVSTGAPRLMLEADQSCYMPGDTVTVSLRMLSVPDLIRGGQFFLGYDHRQLELLSIDPGEPPFTLEIYECSTVHGDGDDCQPSPGLIDYAVGIPDGASPVRGDRRMAVLTFLAREQICSAEDVIVWREHDPPSRLSDDQGQPVAPSLRNLSLIDEQPPVLSSLQVTGCPLYTSPSPRDS